MVTKGGTDTQHWLQLEALGFGGLCVGLTAAVVLVSVVEKVICGVEVGVLVIVRAFWRLVSLCFREGKLKLVMVWLCSFRVD